MPESDAQKELKRQQAELERSMREDGPTTIPDGPKQGDSIFKQEELPPDNQEQRPSPSNVKVVENAGGDGMEGMNTNKLLRELIQAVKAIPVELNDLLRQD